MLKIYCLITGDDYNLVKNETPESRKKISMYGMIIFLPVMLWLIQGYLIVSCIMKGSALTAILTSLTAGLTVFVIERAIVMSNGGKLIFVTRILLGTLIALIGALTVDEVLFKNDIDRQLEENKRKYVTEEVKKWEDANIEIINKQSVITGSKDSARKDALQIYLDEINGTGGTGRRGVDIVAKEKMRIYTEKNSEYESEKIKLDTLKGRFEKDKNEFTGNLLNSSDDGLLLHRIQAMFDLIIKNRTMMMFCLIFTLVFLIIELLVVILKMFSSKTNYERMNEMKESIGASRINRLKEKDPEHFRTSSVHPGVMKLNEHLKCSVPKLF